MVPTNLKGVSALRRALARNEAIGILPDQDPGKSGGIHAPFFGRSARTMLLFSRLAARSGAPALFVIAERLPAARGYRMHFIPASSDVTSSDDLTAASALNRDIERCVRINPAQYQWSYKRFKGQPAGQADPYRRHRKAA